MLHSKEKEMIVAYKMGEAEKFNALYDELQGAWTCVDPLCDCRLHPEPKIGLIGRFESNLRHSKNKGKK
jgi:hypothetical protein